MIMLMNLNTWTYLIANVFYVSVTAKKISFVGKTLVWHSIFSSALSLIRSQYVNTNNKKKHCHGCHLFTAN